MLFKLNLEKGESQEVTEILCEFGHYRCVGSGQGLICSGDAYTHRFDNITSQFTNVVRCADDSLLWKDLEPPPPFLGDIIYKQSLIPSE